MRPTDRRASVSPAQAPSTSPGRREAAKSRVVYVGVALPLVGRAAAAASSLRQAGEGRQQARAHPLFCASLRPGERGAHPVFCATGKMGNTLDRQDG